MYCLISIDHFVKYGGLSSNSEKYSVNSFSVGVVSDDYFLGMFLLISVVCSLWRYALQSKLLGTAKRLAAAEYGENLMPSFIDPSRDKAKLEKLNGEWKKRSGKELKNLEKEKEKKKEEKLEKDEKSDESAKHSKELQNFVDKHEKEDKKKNKSQTKAISMKEWCEQTGWNEEQMEEYWIYYWTEAQKKELIQKYLEEVWKGLTVAFNGLFGCYVMWCQPSFWDTKLLWIQFPQQETWRTTALYCISAGYHMHRAVFQFFEHQRKDFV
ncbi:hypothetical protein RFI_04410, partial [Reticulomyxa filosa]